MVRSRTWKAAVLASGQAATAVVGILTAMVLSRVFDKAAYASYVQTLLAYQFVAPLLTLGLPTALYYFLPVEKERGRAILFENLILLTLAGLVFTAFIFAGGNVWLAHHFNNPELEKTLLVYAVFPIMALPASATTACLMVYDKIKWVPLFTVSTRLAGLVLIVGLVFLLKPTPSVAISASVTGAAITVVVGMVLMLRSTCGSGGSVGIAGMKAQLAYSIPMGLGAMIATLHRNLDKLLVSTFATPERFAVYANGAMEIPLIGVITGSATAVLLPEMRQLMAKDGNKELALKIWQRAGIKAGVMIIPLMGILLALAPDVMVILYSEKYRESHQIFRLYLLLLPIRIVIFGAVFQAAGRTDLIFKRSIIALVANLILSCTFAVMFGYKFIAAATVLAIYLAAVPYSLWKVGQLFGVGVRELLPWKQIMRLFGVTCLGFVASVILVIWAPLDVPIVRVAIVGTIYTVLIVIGLSKAGLCRFNLSRGLPLRARLVWTLD